MKTKEILIEKQQEYIALLLDETAKLNSDVWEKRCKLLDAEIKMLKEKLDVTSKSKKEELTKEEAKKIADKIRGLKGSDFGINF